MSAAKAEKVIVLGGTSEIALAIVAELQARDPRRVGLLGRDPAALAGAASELERLDCREAWTAPLDANDTTRHEQELAEAFARVGGADIVIVAVGKLGERGTLLEDIPAALDVLRVNTVGTASLALHAARLLRAQESGGTLIVLSSSAAWRARPSNVAYGASKAGLDALADGLATMLAPEGVRVLVVRPGLVHTRMTSGLPAAPFATTPEKVARRVVDKLDGSATIVWAPAVMRMVMALARALPRSLFRRVGW
jgi:decaprenylphospho-beta-D-erythro-pentofuranosid-2-ulose 2-reductase